MHACGNLVVKASKPPCYLKDTISLGICSVILRIIKKNMEEIGTVYNILFLYLYICYPVR